MAIPVTIGLDIAKNVFQVHGVDETGAVVAKRRLRRPELVDFFKTIEPCLVGIESCGSAHHWARSLTGLGHQVRLMPPSYVKPYVKSQKNDAADAEAICEAVRRPTMRFVPVKSEEQQAVLMLHRTRDLLIRARSKLKNAFRSHLAEFGRVEGRGSVGLSTLLKSHGDLDALKVPAAARLALDFLADQIRTLDFKVDELDDAIQAWHRANPLSRRLATIPGIGPLTASALVATIADPHAFQNGRQLAAWIGLVPRQYASGDTQKLGKITKAGDRYLRRLLVLGAHNVLATARAGRTTISPTTAALLARKPFKVVCVALANKMARTAWAVMSKEEDFIPRAVVRLEANNRTR